MRLLFVTFFCLSMTAFVWAVRQTPPTFKEKFTKRMKEFSGNMYKEIVENARAENMIFSPLSIYHTLGMVNVGAGGNTKSELLRAMRLNKPDDEFTEEKRNKRMNKLLRHTLDKTKGTTETKTLANALFLQEAYSIRPLFQTTLQKYYRAEVQTVDFSNASASAKSINDWVADQTKDKITGLIAEDKIQANTRLVLVNAIYFRDRWLKPFNNTPEPMDFTLYGGTTTEVKAMHLDFTFPYLDLARENMKLYAIPYSDKETYMVIGLPEENEGLNTFTSKARTILSKMDSISTWRKVTTTLTMPKFKVELETDVKPIMKALGIRDLFKQGTADLSGIGDEELFVSDFLHKAFIKVNEKGTEAAAATSAIASGRSIGNGPQPIMVNKPFFYGIFDDKANVFTFLGQITDPRTSKDRQ